MERTCDNIAEQALEEVFEMTTNGCVSAIAARIMDIVAVARLLPGKLRYGYLLRFYDGVIEHALSRFDSICNTLTKKGELPTVYDMAPEESAWMYVANSLPPLDTNINTAISNLLECAKNILVGFKMNGPGTRMEYPGRPDSYYDTLSVITEHLDLHNRISSLGPVLVVNLSDSHEKVGPMELSMTCFQLNTTNEAGETVRVLYSVPFTILSGIIVPRDAQILGSDIKLAAAEHISFLLVQHMAEELHHAHPEEDPEKAIFDFGMQFGLFEKDAPINVAIGKLKSTLTACIIAEVYGQDAVCGNKTLQAFADMGSDTAKAHALIQGILSQSAKASETIPPISQIILRKGSLTGSARVEWTIQGLV